MIYYAEMHRQTDLIERYILHRKPKHTIYACMKQGMVTTRSTLGLQSQNVKYQLPDFTGSLHCPSLYSHRTSNISFLTLQEVCIVRDLALHYLFVSMLVHCIWGASLIANASRLSVHFGKNMSYVLKHFD